MSTNANLPLPNAAVGYLMALGKLDIPAPILEELAKVESLADLGKITSDARSRLRIGMIPTSIALFNQGAACEKSRFGYERTYRPEEPAPPFRLLRNLGRVARAYGLYCLAEGREADAGTVFRSLFCMGSHLESEGSMIAGMVGMSMKEMGLRGLRELFSEGKDAAVIGACREFLRVQPGPVQSFQVCIEGEKRAFSVALDMIRNGAGGADDDRLKRDWDTMISLFPEVIGLPEGSTQDSALPVEPSQSEIDRLRAFLTGSEFAQIRNEALGILDEALTFDPAAPDFLARVEEFDRKTNASGSTIIQSLPGLGKMAKKILELEELRQSLSAG